LYVHRLKYFDLALLFLAVDGGGLLVFAAIAALRLPRAAVSRGSSCVRNAAHVTLTNRRKICPSAVVLASKNPRVVSV
jgi:hypothetical protein